MEKNKKIPPASPVRPILSPRRAPPPPSPKFRNPNKVYKCARPSDERRPQSIYMPGMILSTVHHEPRGDMDSEDLGDNVSETNFGSVYSKYRKFIVAKRYKQHLLAFPIYTHGHQGLAGKWTSDEFVHVFDARARTQDPSGFLSRPLFAIPTPNFMHIQEGFHAFNGDEFVRFTFPYPIKYDARTIIEGTLEPESLKYLLELFQGIAPGSELDLRPQAQPMEKLESQLRQVAVLSTPMNGVIQANPAPATLPAQPISAALQSTPFALSAKPAPAQPTPVMLPTKPAPVHPAPRRLPTAPTPPQAFRIKGSAKPASAAGAALLARQRALIERQRRRLTRP